MGEKPSPVLGWPLVAFMAVMVALGPILMVATRGWAYSAVYVLALTFFMGALLLGVIAFSRLGVWLGEWSFFALATVAVPGSFALLTLLRRWGLGEAWWSEPLAMVVVFVPLVSWFVAVERLGANAPPTRQAGRATYRIAIGWRIFAWAGGIGFALAPFAAWLQQGRVWHLAFTVAWLLIGSIAVAFVVRRRVVVGDREIWVRSGWGGWQSAQLSDLRRIVAPQGPYKDTTDWRLRFADGTELAIPQKLAASNALIAELHTYLPENELDA